MRKACGGENRIPSSMKIKMNCIRQTRFGVSALGLAAALFAMQPAAAKTPWPDGAAVAVVLTYEDALASQLENAVPALDAANF